MHDFGPTFGPAFEFTKGLIMSELETSIHERKSTQSHKMISHDPVVIIGNVLFYFYSQCSKRKKWMRFVPGQQLCFKALSDIWKT